MRKADYALLARLIKREIEVYENLSSGGPRLDTLSRLVRDFTDAAHVDKAAFTRACGIPGAYQAKHHAPT